MNASQSRFLDELNKHSVQYMGFGDTALHAYSPQDRPANQLRLWVDPTETNLQNANAAIAAFHRAEPGQLSAAQQIAPDAHQTANWKALVDVKPEGGIRREITPSVVLYGAIPGHPKESFGAVKERSERVDTSRASFSERKSAPDAGVIPVSLAVLHPKDQVLNLQASGSSIAKASLVSLLDHAARHNVSVLAPDQTRQSVSPQPPLRQLSEQERERAKTIFENLAEIKAKGEKATKIEAGRGFHQYRVNGKTIRDREAIAKELDLEAVMQSYGMVQDVTKNSKSSAWRLYRWNEEGNQERLGVGAMQGHEKKVYVNLNDVGERGVFPKLGETGFGDKGDTLSFIFRQEKDFNRMYQVIDRLAVDPEFKLRTEQVPALARQTRVRTEDQALQRERDLGQQYGLSPIDASAYLTKRFISEEVQMDPAFQGQIQKATMSGVSTFKRTDGTEGTKAYTHENTAFPMRDETGNIISLDMRNEGFKRFPEGERGGAIWRSNDLVSFPIDMKLSEGDSIEAGTPLGMYKKGEAYVFATGIDPNRELDEQKPITFAMQPQQLKQMMQAGEGPQKIPFNRIVVVESPVDALSHKQLNPEKVMADGTAENRLYIATGGQPGERQFSHIQKLMHQNPQAQMVLAMDGDNAGLRFMTNFLRLDHPHERTEVKVTPSITYVSPPKTLADIEKDKVARTQGASDKQLDEEKSNIDYKGYNRLTLLMEAPPRAGEDRAKEVHGKFIDELISAIKIGIPAEKLATGDRERSVALVSQQTVLEKPYFMDQPASKEHIELLQTELKDKSRAFLPQYQGRDLREGDPVKTLVPSRLVTTAEIMIPNDNKLLVSTLNKLVHYSNDKQQQELVKVNRVNVLSSNAEGKAVRLKDFNDVLKDRKGREARPSDKYALDSPPLIVDYKHANENRLEKERQQQQLQEQATKQPAPRVITFGSPDDKIKVSGMRQ